MGNKKRKLNDDDAPSSVSKKKKESDFTAADFISLLKSNQNAAFETFISRAKQHEAGDVFDIIDDFCRDSCDCDDIFKILDTMKFVANEVFLILDWLQIVLNRVAKDLKNYRSALGAVVRRALVYVSSSKVTWLLAMRNKSNQLKSILKLMMGIVRQGSWAAREVMTWLEINNALLVPLLNRRDLRDDEDVKTCLVELLVLLLACDDYSVIRRILEIKGFLNKVVADLIGDKVSTVVLFLTVLHQKVVCNPNITKTSKIRFFHEQTLTDICKLHRWNGPKHWKEMNQKPKRQSIADAVEPEDILIDPSSLSSDQEAIREVTHTLLKELCCSVKNGIIFHDKSFGASGQNANHILTNFLNALYKPERDGLIFKLLLEILRSSPDQLQFYLPSLHLSCTPRCTSGWMQNAAFVRKIYESQPLVSPVVKFFSSVTVDELVAMVMSTVLPPGDLWCCFKEAVTTTWLPVVHESLLLVSVVVRRLVATVKEIQKLSADGTGVSFNADLFLDLVINTFIKELPEITALIGYWERLVNSLDSGGNNDAVKTNSLENGDDETAEVLTDAPLFDKLSLALQVLCGYCHLFPKSCQDHLDFSCFLTGLEKAEKHSTNELKERECLPYLYLVRLLSVSNVQLKDLISQSSLERPSIFERLLNIAISVDENRSGKLKNIVFLLLSKLMTNCAVFSDNFDEIEVWLRHLTSVDSKQRNICINLFVYAVKKLLNDSDSEEMKSNSNNERSPKFFGLMSVILKRKVDAEDFPEDFVDGVLVDIFHLQRDFSAFARALGKDAARFLRVNGLLHRCKSKKSKNEFNVAYLRNLDLTILLEKCFTFGHSLSVTDVHSIADSAIELLSSDDCLRVTRQLVCYLSIGIQQYVEGDKSRKDEITFYVDTIIKVAERGRNLTEIEGSLAETSEPIVGDDELLMLDISEQKGNQIIFQICSAIFNSAAVEKYFLWKAENDAGCKKPVSAAKASKLVTRKFSAFVEDILGSFSGREFHILVVPVAKVEREMENFIIGSCDEVVLEAIGVFIGLVRLSVVGDFVERCLLGHKTCLTDANGKLNKFGKVFLKAFEHFVKSDDETLELSDGFVVAAFDLSQVGIAEYCELLVLLLRKLCQRFDCVEKGSLVRLLETGKRATLAVVAELVGANEKCLKLVAQWLTANKSWKKLKVEYQNVVYEVLKRSSEDKVLCQIILKVFWKHLLDLAFSDSFQNLHSDLRIVAEFLHRLIPHASTEVLNQCWDRMISAASSHSTPAQVQFCVALCENLLAEDAYECGDQGCLFVNACLDALTTFFNSRSDDDERSHILIDGITKLLLGGKLKNSCLQESVLASWEGFTKAGLKHRSTDCHFLRLFETLVAHLYPLEDDELESAVTNIVSPKRIYEMVIGLSHFLPTILKVVEDDVKGAIISLLHCLVLRSSKCCESSHITFLLSAYHATLSATDQRILMLLHHYETAGCAVTNFKPYFWGQQAIEHHATGKTLGMSLLPENRMEQIVDLLDSSRVHRSILNFPLRRRLELDDKVRDANFLKTCDDCYDPVFLLPLFSHLFEPGGAVNCVKFIESNCLGYVLAALSCYNAGIRSVAYHTLSAFQEHLNRARFPERMQVAYVLECLHSSIKEPNQKLASIITIFLAKAVRLMLSPKDHMYSPINEFLLLKPAMDISNVPEFYKLFYATGLEFKTERLWILNLLLDGLRDTHDYHIMEKRLTFKIIMSFYTFSVSDHQSKMIVLKILTKACGIRTVGKDLVENHGLLAWIANISADIIREKRSAHMTTGVVNCVVEMLSALWTAVAVTDHDDRVCLQPIVTAEMMMTSKKVYKYFRNCLGETARETCERTMIFAKEYSQKTVSLFPEWADVLE